MSTRVRPRTVRTDGALEELVDYYLSVDEFVFDVETVGKRRGHPKVNRVMWLGMAHGDRVDVIPLGHPRGELVTAAYSEKEPWWDENDLTKRGKPRKKWRTVRHPAVFTDPPPQLWPGDVFAALKPIFFGDAVKVGHNVKFDVETLAKYYDGQPPAPPYGDTWILSRLLNSTLSAKLKDIVVKLYDHKYDIEDIAKPDKHGENGIEIHPFSKAARYTGLDVRYTWMIWREFSLAIQKQGLGNLSALEHDLLEVLVDMELEGVRLDRAQMETLARRLAEDLVEIEKRIFSASGKVWDLNSTPAKQEFIYEERGHEVFAWTKGGQDGKNKKPSTAKGVLEAIAVEDPIVGDLLEHAAVDKLASTYTGRVNEDGAVEGGLIAHIVDDRVHTDIVQVGPETGRVSSRNPNLQNIPTRSDDERAQALRRMFIADPGHLLIVADYSQIEYRVLAELSRDPTLLRAFAEGWDPHAAVMAMILGKPVEEVTKAERDAGKGVNFAEIYGAGPGKVASMAGVSVERAKKIKKEHHRQFPKVQAFKREVVSQARSRRPPYVTTILGRRRYLPALFAQDDDARFGAERQAVNTAVQGSAADIIKVAMVKLHRVLPVEASLLLQVHDELMVQAPESTAEDVCDLVKATMASVRLLKRVPLEVDANIGDSWAAAK